MEERMNERIKVEKEEAAVTGAAAPADRGY